MKTPDPFLQACKAEELRGEWGVCGGGGGESGVGVRDCVCKQGEKEASVPALPHFFPNVGPELGSLAS